MAFYAAPAPGLMARVGPIAPVGYNSMLTNYLKAGQIIFTPARKKVV